MRLPDWALRPRRLPLAALQLPGRLVFCEVSALVLSWSLDPYTWHSSWTGASALDHGFFAGSGIVGATLIALGLARWLRHRRSA